MVIDCHLPHPIPSELLHVPQRPTLSRSILLPFSFYLLSLSFFLFDSSVSHWWREGRAFPTHARTHAHTHAHTHTSGLKSEIPQLLWASGERHLTESWLLYLGLTVHTVCTTKKCVQTIKPLENICNFGNMFPLLKFIFLPTSILIGSVLMKKRTCCPLIHRLTAAEMLFVIGHSGNEL